jgi:hypothetical protein
MTERETERDKHETPTTTLLKKQTLEKICLQQEVCHQWATLLWTSKCYQPHLKEGKPHQKKKKKANRNDPETHTPTSSMKKTKTCGERKEERKKETQGNKERKQTSNVLNGVCLEPQHKQYCKQTNPKTHKTQTRKKNMQTYIQTNKHIKQTTTTTSLPLRKDSKKWIKQTTHKIIYYDSFIPMTQGLNQKK